MQHKLKFSLLIPAAFLVSYFVPKLLPKPASYLELLATRDLAPLLIAFAATWYLHRRIKSLPSAWGFDSGMLTGVKMAFIFCLPMLAGYGFLADFTVRIDWQSFWFGCVVAAIFEELLYRGFLFGQLFRYGGWGFIPSALLNAVLFGSGHLYQSNDVSGAIGVFTITALGGMWFAWLYIEWNNNLWIAIFMHFFMNSWWTSFNIDDNAAGGFMANIIRGTTIALSIIYTVRMKRKTGGLTIGINNLFIQKVQTGRDRMT